MLVFDVALPTRVVVEVEVVVLLLLLIVVDDASIEVEFPSSNVASSSDSEALTPTSGVCGGIGSLFRSSQLLQEIVVCPRSKSKTTADRN